jgi:hypothetical protein
MIEKEGETKPTLKEQIFKYITEHPEDSLRMIAAYLFGGFVVLMMIYAIVKLVL